MRVLYGHLQEQTRISLLFSSILGQKQTGLPFTFVKNNPVLFVKTVEKRFFRTPAKMTIR